MNRHSTRRTLLAVATVIGLAILTGCKQEEIQATTAAPTTPVKVVEIRPRTVPIYHEYVGHTKSPRSVDVRARIKGWLEQVMFQPGSDVDQGQLLYVIDPRTDRAELDKALGQLASSKAAAAFAQRESQRYAELVEKGSVSRETFRDAQAKAQETSAEVKASRAAVEQARLTLGYSKIIAPFSGRISRTLVDEGNLVGANSENTVLTSIVQLDPIYVYFNPSETHLLAIEQQQKHSGALNVAITVPGGTSASFSGTLDFIDNRITRSTGTIQMRATVANKDKLLLPGQFVRVRLFVGKNSNALLVPSKALMQTQGGFSVYVVDRDNKVASRHVMAGRVYGEKTVITKGLKAGDKVMVSALQAVQPGMAVEPRLLVAKK